MIRLLAALTAIALLAGDASADNRRAPADIRAVIEGKTLAASTLVGRSGQMFVPRKEGGWTRAGRGGVACDIHDAFELSGKLWAVCSWAPLFVRNAGIWSARPLTNRGRTRVSRAGKSVVLSIGRHVYTWGGDWKRRSSAPGRIASLHAESATRYVMVTTRGTLMRGSGSSWTELVEAPSRHDKNADPPARVFGSQRHSYAISAAGVLSLVGSRSLAPVALPAGVTAIDIGATTSRANGEVLAAVVVTRGGNKESALATLDGPKLTLAPLPAPPGSPASLIREIGGQILVTTRVGRAFVRDSAGAWTEAPLVNEPPSQPRSADNGGPARSR